MNATNIRDRIWDKAVDTERMSRYYSRRSEKFGNIHNWATYVIGVLLFGVVFLYQSPYCFWGICANTVAVILLFVISAGELYLLQFSPATEWKASSVMGLQSGKLAEHWRQLWIDFENGNLDNIEQRVRSLEDQTRHISVTTIPYHNKTNEQCDQEAKREFELQFGG